MPQTYLPYTKNILNALDSYACPITIMTYYHLSCTGSGGIQTPYLAIHIHNHIKTQIHQSMILCPAELMGCMYVSLLGISI